MSDVALQEVPVQVREMSVLVELYGQRVLKEMWREMMAVYGVRPHRDGKK